MSIPEALITFLYLEEILLREMIEGYGLTLGILQVGMCSIRQSGVRESKLSLRHTIDFIELHEYDYIKW